MDKTELQMKRERMLSSTYKKILVLYTHKGGPRGGASGVVVTLSYNRDLLDLPKPYAWGMPRIFAISEALTPGRQIPGTAPVCIEYKNLFICRG